MNIRIYQYDGQVSNTPMLHATCVAEFDIAARDWKRQRRQLLHDHEGDFYTVNERKENVTQLLCSR